MKKISILAVALAFALSASAATTTQKPKISMSKARAIALKTAPGKVKSAELENEKGKLIYSFDISGKSGITEVNVDAMTGKVIDTQHETAAKEAAEKQKEALEKKAPPATKH